jgi:hypothetical protein
MKSDANSCPRLGDHSLSDFQKAIEVSLAPRHTVELVNGRVLFAQIARFRCCGPMLEKLIGQT